MTDYSFPNSEHLKSRKTIDYLFREGLSLKVFPMRFQFHISTPEEKEVGMNVGFVVSKRTRKNAVDRNAVKRQIRESFRLNREPLQLKLDATSLHLDMMIIFINPSESSYNHIDKAMKKAIKILCEKL